MNVRRLRAGGRNLRDENSSDESEDERSESDNSVGDDHTSDSAVGRSPPNSEDDPPGNRRPGRDARTRANVTFFIITYIMLTGELGKNKTTSAKEDWEKRLRHRDGVFLCIVSICYRI